MNNPCEECPKDSYCVQQCDFVKAYDSDRYTTSKKNTDATLIMAVITAISSLLLFICLVS